MPQIIGYVLIQLGAVVAGAGGRMVADELSVLAGEDLTGVLAESLSYRKLSSLADRRIRSRAG